MAHHAEEQKPSIHVLEVQSNNNHSSTNNDNDNNNNNNRDGSDAHIVSFDNLKAGLQKVDKKQVEEVIENLSKGSNFYNNKKRKREKRQKKIEELLQKEKVEYQKNVLQNPLRYKATCAEVAKIEADLLEQTPYRDMEIFNQQAEATRNAEGSNATTPSTPPDLIRIFVHVDMDMFFAAVEEKKDPQLKTVPFAVGSMSMLSTSNYIARQYGVRSGMPGFIAKRLCPQLKLIPVDYESYRKESVVFHDVCRQYDEHLVSIGCDELTMEIGSYVHTVMQQEGRDRAGKREGEDGNTEENEDKKELSRVERYFLKAADVVNQIRAEVHARTGMTCSAGIGVSPTFAKFASNVNKPNGQLLLPLFSHEAVMHFLRDKSVREIPGIGESTEHLLHGLGVRTMGDVYREKLKLYVLFTRKTFLFLFGASLGVCGMFDFYSRHQDKTGNNKKKKKNKKKKQKAVDGEAPADSGSSNDDSGSSTSASDSETGTSREHSRGGGPPDQQRAYDRIFHSFSRKSVGHEHTFHNLKSRLELEDIALRCLRDSVEVIQRKQLLCGHVVIKLKHVTFDVKQYSKMITPFPGTAAAAAPAVKSEPLPPQTPAPAPENPPPNGTSLPDGQEQQPETSELIYEFENKYYTDQYELLKYNLYAILSPVVEHYAQYRLLGVRLEKLISKVHLCAYQKWFAHTPLVEDGLRKQKTLKYFFQQTKKTREGATGPKPHGGEKCLENNKERLYYILSESEEEEEEEEGEDDDGNIVASSSVSSVSPSSSASVPAPALGQDLQGGHHYETISSSSQMSKTASITLEHSLHSRHARATGEKKEENPKQDDGDDDEVLIIE